MKWYWKVRLYGANGYYHSVEIETARNLGEIDAMQDFYLALTGYKMVVEGMRETSFGLPSVKQAFERLFVPRKP